MVNNVLCSESLTGFVDRYHVALLPVSLSPGCKLTSQTFFLPFRVPGCALEFNPWRLTNYSALCWVHCTLTYTCVGPHPREFSPKGQCRTCTGKGVFRTVVGAKNMLQTVPFLCASNECFLDLTLKGWMAMKSNMEAIIESLVQITAMDERYYCAWSIKQLFSQIQTVWRVPIPPIPHYSNGYHMGGGWGEVTVVLIPLFKTVFDQGFPLIAAHSAAFKITVLLALRYLFTGCCKNVSHALNVGSPPPRPHLHITGKG